ncbi:hypothetical protein A6U87_12605 [Rhizobium sp. AC44/96]|nr:hypothetical protein A6U87_12605 [Rhizobium sp. AC44/96]
MNPTIGVPDRAPGIEAMALIDASFLAIREPRIDKAVAPVTPACSPQRGIDQLSLLAFGGKYENSHHISRSPHRDAFQATMK